MSHVPEEKKEPVNISHTETSANEAGGSGSPRTPSSLVGAFLQSKMDERAEAAAKDTEPEYVSFFIFAELTPEGVEVEKLPWISLSSMVYMIVVEYIVSVNFRFCALLSA